MKRKGAGDVEVSMSRVVCYSKSESVTLAGERSKLSYLARRIGTLRNLSLSKYTRDRAVPTYRILKKKIKSRNPYLSTLCTQFQFLLFSSLHIVYSITARRRSHILCTTILDPDT